MGPRRPLMQDSLRLERTDATAKNLLLKFFLNKNSSQQFRFGCRIPLFLILFLMEKRSMWEYSVPTN
uniref:Uncharacterized protein n=1 Tax=Oryza brachyantha TaxID=4533 RepID=J3LB00_ORYBR